MTFSFFSSGSRSWSVCVAFVTTSQTHWFHVTAHYMSCRPLKWRYTMTLTVHAKPLHSRADLYCLIAYVSFWSRSLGWRVCPQCYMTLLVAHIYSMLKYRMWSLATYSYCQSLYYRRQVYTVCLSLRVHLQLWRLVTKNLHLHSTYQRNAQ